MTEAIQPFHRVSEQEDTQWLLRVMRVHFALVGIILLVGAIVLAAYLYMLEFKRVEMDWANLRVEQAGKIYQQETQLQLLAVVLLGMMSLVLLQAVRRLGRHATGSLATIWLSVLILFAGIPAGLIVWNLQISSFIPTALFQVMGGLLIGQALLTLWYVIGLLVTHPVLKVTEAVDRPLRKMRTLGLVLWLVVVLALGAALGVLTDWLYEIPVSQPEPGKLLYATSFDDLNDEWDIYPGRDSASIELLPDASGSVEGSALVVKYGSPYTNSAVFSSLDRKFNDMDLRVTAQPLSGPTDNQYGVVFRYRDNENYYGFFLSSDGRYTLAKAKDGELTFISEWGLSDVIHQGYTANEIRVIAQGDEFRFFVNGQPIPLCLHGANTFSMWNGYAGANYCYTDALSYVFRDDDFTQGRVGLATGTSGDVSDDVRVAFDDLILVGPDAELLRRTMPGEFLYTTSFDVSDKFDTGVMGQWETFEGTDSAQIVASRELNLTRLTEQVLTATERVLLVTYGSAQAHGMVWSNLNREFDDMDLRVTTWNVASPQDNQYGVVFRQQDDQNYYGLFISSDGRYKLEKVKDGQIETISPWGISDVIQPGMAPNQIRIVASGDQFQFFVNDQPLALCLKGTNEISMWAPELEGQSCQTANVTTVYQDADFGEGQIGLAAGHSVDTSSPVVIAFDDLLIARPE